MEKKLYKVPVTWTMSGTYYIRASSPEEAKEAVFDAELPEGQYLDDSFEIDGDIEEETYYQPQMIKSSNPMRKMMTFARIAIRPSAQ